MSESPRNNDKDIDEILTKIRSPHTKSNSKNENQERAVWNVGQRLRGIYVCGVCVCVCVRVRGCLGLGERTAGKPPYVLSCYYENV